VIFLQMPNGTFQADGETLAYSHSLLTGEPREIALSLHGAGPAGRDRISYLAEHLVARAARRAAQYSRMGRSKRRQQEHHPPRDRRSAVGIDGSRF
jgi:hypothetical protein